MAHACRVPNRTSPGPSCDLTTSRNSGPRSRADTAPTRERQHRAPPRRRPPLPAVRPAGPGGWRRPGRLHAPEAARTGPVSASRPFSRTYAQGGCRLNGKWPLTGFLAGESPNQTWGAMLTDLNGLKAVGIFWPTIVEQGSRPLGSRGLRAPSTLRWTPSLRGAQTHSMGATPFRGAAGSPSKLNRPAGAF